MKINLNSQFLRECVCKFLDKEEDELQDKDISNIKYLHIMGQLGGYICLSNADVPNYIYFYEMGDETTNLYDLWNTNLNLEKAISKKVGKKGGFYLEKVSDIQNRLENNETEMEKFQKNIIEYNLPPFYMDKMDKVSTEQEFIKSLNEMYKFLNVDFNDLKFFSGLEALRITDLEGSIIDSLEFLLYMPRLRILELGGEYVIKHMKGIEVLKQLNQLCVWEE